MDRMIGRLRDWKIGGIERNAAEIPVPRAIWKDEAVLKSIQLHCEKFQQQLAQDRNLRIRQELVERLRKSTSYIPELPMVALLNGEIVGHIMLTRNKIINENAVFESRILYSWQWSFQKED